MKKSVHLEPDIELLINLPGTGGWSRRSRADSDFRIEVLRGRKFILLDANNRKLRAILCSSRGELAITMVLFTDLD